MNTIQLVILISIIVGLNAMKEQKSKSVASYLKDCASACIFPHRHPCCSGIDVEEIKDSHGTKKTRHGVSGYSKMDKGQGKPGGSVQAPFDDPQLSPISEQTGTPYRALLTTKDRSDQNLAGRATGRNHPIISGISQM